MKTGEAPALIAAHEAALSATPGNLASQLSLAYLFEAVGENDSAQKLWAATIR